LKPISMTKFEQPPIQLIPMCFAYLDFYNLYELFFCLNQCFK
ncbi:unnamed protein product, partial [Rotaria sp. Silwood2]